AAALAAYGRPSDAEMTFRHITQRPLTPEEHENVVADNLRCSRPAWEAWLKRGSREDISGLLRSLTLPCRLLVGTDDRAITPATQRQHTLPWLPADSAFVQVPGAGHLLPLEAPTAVV